MPRTGFFAVCLISIASAASAQSKGDIDKLNQAWMAAINKGDAATVAAMYTDDATLLPQGAPMGKGRAEIQDYWSKASQQVGDFVLTAIDVKPLGDGVGREIGTFTAKGKGSPAENIVGKYVVIWQRVGSDWKLAVDIFNTDE
ncbi:MAG: SgcJ/EcaC family oxidoreductase [Alphaproteobacteria bacterium]|nr:SgcJ/EcaC family oxidoreductase [Alphaproteobacteria bacterium]MBV9860891.1 SgcJ/EcaC family oxidoreductase [Alphaproteobacteria bacterium]